MQGFTKRREPIKGVRNLFTLEKNDGIKAPHCIFSPDKGRRRPKAFKPFFKGWKIFSMSRPYPVNVCIK